MYNFRHFFFVTDTNVDDINKRTATSELRSSDGYQPSSKISFPNLQRHYLERNESKILTDIARLNVQIPADQRQRNATYSKFSRKTHQIVNSSSKERYATSRITYLCIF